MLSLSTELYAPQAMAEEIPRLGARTGQPFAVSTTDPVNEKVREEDTVRVSISKDASDMLTKVEGETLPAAAAEEDNEAQDHSDYDLKDDANEGAFQDRSASQYSTASGTADVDGLTPAEEDMVERLQARDREVRAHEQQHMAAAGELAVGGPQYDYQRGPDGKMYAIGGHVNIDTGSETDPGRARLKAEKIRSAALSVGGDASSADVAAAAQASFMGNDATAQMSESDERSLALLAQKIQSVYGANSLAATGQYVNTQG